MFLRIIRERIRVITNVSLSESMFRWIIRECIGIITNRILSNLLFLMDHSGMHLRYRQPSYQIVVSLIIGKHHRSPHYLISSDGSFGTNAYHASYLIRIRYRIRMHQQSQVSLSIDVRWHSGTHPRYHQRYRYLNLLFLLDHSGMHPRYHQRYRYLNPLFLMESFGNASALSPTVSLSESNVSLGSFGNASALSPTPSDRYQLFLMDHSGMHRRYHQRYHYPNLTFLIGSFGNASALSPTPIFISISSFRCITSGTHHKDHPHYQHQYLTDQSWQLKDNYPQDYLSHPNPYRHSKCYHKHLRWCHYQYQIDSY